jgi:hypothetical protein
VLAKGFSTEELKSTEILRIMSSGADEAAREKCRGTGNFILEIFIAQAKTSVTTKQNGARLSEGRVSGVKCR